MTHGPAAPPVLDFAARPHGAPPPVLTGTGSGGYARRPSGGEPMLVLRRSPDVLRALTDTAAFGMAGVTAAGQLRGCPLTGAEMQSPDGGLLSMNPPLLREYRRRIGYLFTRLAAVATLPAVRGLAAGGAASLARRDSADVLASYAAPLAAAAISRALGVPRHDWEGRLAQHAAVAFAVVPGPDAVSAVAAAWGDLYDYYGRAPGTAPPGSLAAELGTALDGFTPAQITHVTATVSNGFGAILPVLAVALAELARRPQLIAACARGERTWVSVADDLLRRRATFPAALPRVALRDTRIADRDITEGAVVLPSLIAAAHDRDTPPACGIAFGAGPHTCPGAHLSRAWLAVALKEFFGAFPRAHLTGGLDWQPGTLPVPRDVTVALR
jgi:cytochrome P450